MNDYSKIYTKAKRTIKILPYGNIFYLRDLIENPPILLGTWLYKNVAEKTIPDVVFIGKDSFDTNMYKKIKL